MATIVRILHLNQTIVAEVDMVVEVEEEVEEHGDAEIATITTKEAVENGLPINHGSRDTIRSQTGKQKQRALLFYRMTRERLTDRAGWLSVGRSNSSNNRSKSVNRNNRNKSDWRSRRRSENRKWRP